MEEGRAPDEARRAERAGLTRRQVEIVRLVRGSTQIEEVHGSRVFRLRGELIPILSLGEELGLERVDRAIHALGQGGALAAEGPVEQVVRLGDEVGDLLFAAVNLARHLRVDPEEALRRANRRFEQRFNYVESSVSANGESIENVGTDALEALWIKAKSSGL